MKHILSLGAGVQSSTLALMAAHGEIEPMPECAVFADTQAEPQPVYEWLDWLEGQLPFPVHRVTAGSIEDTEKEYRTSKAGNTYRKTTMPLYTLGEDGAKGQLWRKCTRDFKVTPITQFVRRHCGVNSRRDEVQVTQWIGISLDEIQRQKPSQYKWCNHRWPLLEKRMTRSACKQWMDSKGYPEPPRSACYFCMFHSNEEWRRLSPEDFQRAVEFERQINDINETHSTGKGKHNRAFLHASRVPLGQVDLSEPTDGQLLLWQDECEGMCGT